MSTVFAVGARRAISAAGVSRVGWVAGAAVSTCLAAGSAHAAVCAAAFGVDFASSYTCDDLGTPTGVTGRLGGITFLNNNTLLVGGDANVSSGYIAEIGVIRDASNHIVGFSGPSTVFATAPFIDGGLEFGPSGVLFATGYPNNTVLEYKPGSTAPDKTVTLDSSLSSVGALAFVPAGFAGAGDFKIVQYNGSGNWADATLTPDGSGTYDIATSVVVALGRGPEGIAYISGANPGFGTDSILLSEYSTGTVGVYDIDSAGDPIAGSRRDFLNALTGAEGAAVDPLTGDFLFSTFGGGNQIDVVSGFTVTPPLTVPEPSTWAMMLLGFAGLGFAGWRGRRKTTGAAA
jgi:hypothetical protein